MKRIKALLIVLVVLANLVFAQPSLADRPKFSKNPDYIEVTKALNELSKTKDAQAQTDGSTSEDIQKKIDELELQKYALETGVNWGQCRNQTGNTLAVYGPKPNLDDDDDDDDDDDGYPYDNALYFLAAGQTTKEKWDCNGVYLPSGVQASGISPDGKNQTLAQPVAVKIADGTQLVIKTNPDTGAVEFSVPPTKVIKAGEAKWFIPNVTQAAINTRVANAPTAKVVEGTNLTAKRIPDAASEANPPASQPEAIQVEPQPPAKAQTTSPKSSFYIRR